MTTLKIACDGDSNGLGFNGVTPWPTWLKSRIEAEYPRVTVDLTNYSVGSTTSLDKKNALAAILATQPDIYALCIGTNDVGGWHNSNVPWQTTTQTEANLRYIIEAVQSAVSTNTPSGHPYIVLSQPTPSVSKTVFDAEQTTMPYWRARTAAECATGNLTDVKDLCTSLASEYGVIGVPVWDDTAAFGFDGSPTSTTTQAIYLQDGVHETQAMQQRQADWILAAMRSTLDSLLAPTEFLGIFDPAIFDPAIFDTGLPAPVVRQELPRTKSQPSLFILDRFENVVSVLSNEAPGACPFYDDLHTESLDGVLTYEFSVPSDHESAEYVVNENHIIFRDVDGVAKLVTIKSCDDVLDSENRHYKRVEAHNSALSELNTTIIRPITYTAESLSVILAGLLDGTRWEPGDVDFDDYHTFEWRYESVTKALRDIADATALGVRYRVTFTGGRITGRYVDVVGIGEESGKIVDYRKDVRGLTRTGDSWELATACIGVGAQMVDGSEVTFGSVVAGDKPSGQDWVGDPVALAAWGYGDQHRFMVLRDNEETSPTKLLVKARAALAANNAPKYTYQVDAALLDTVSGLEHERMRLGDTVTVRDMTFAPPLFVPQPVWEIRRSYTSPTGGIA